MDTHYLYPSFILFFLGSKQNRIYWSQKVIQPKAAREYTGCKNRKKRQEKSQNTATSPPKNPSQSNNPVRNCFIRTPEFIKEKKHTHTKNINETQQIWKQWQGSKRPQNIDNSFWAITCSLISMYFFSAPFFSPSNIDFSISNFAFNSFWKSSKAFNSFRKDSRKNLEKETFDSFLSSNHEKERGKGRER